MNNKNVKPFLTSQIITYLGNKRKFIKTFGPIIDNIKCKMNKKNLIIGDGFSGSGIVSRLCKLHASELYVNEIASYSKTLNECYLNNLSECDREKVNTYIDNANNFVDNDTSHNIPSYVGKIWSASSDTIIKDDERGYFTNTNGKRIDKYCYFIKNIVPNKYQSYIMGPLIVKCSIHNNTSGQFASYYKKFFGGVKKNDLKRITKKIILEHPVFIKNNCKSKIYQMNTNDWVKIIPEVDIMYYDPPYNKHPYSIYYFMLDIINHWDINSFVPNTLRGQEKTWFKSDYNSVVKAEKAFIDLIQNTKAKYIILSYNNTGIIPLDRFTEILKTKGTIEKIPYNHATYNRLKGIANYKRKKENKKITEFIWVVKCN